jgi:hypothetical protein
MQFDALITSLLVKFLGMVQIQRKPYKLQMTLFACLQYFQYNFPQNLTPV